MASWRELIRRLWGSFRRNPTDPDLEEELRFHLELVSEDAQRHGGSPDQVHRLARLKVGGVGQAMEAMRDQRGLPWLDNMFRDVRFAIRTLRRAPGFTATAIISLALGIGGTTAAFTLLDYVLLRPLPFPKPAQLAMVYQTQIAKGYPRLVTSWPNYRDWKAMNHTFESMGAYTILSANLSGQGDPRRLEGVIAASDVFKALAVPARIGRALTADDDRESATAVVVLSDRLAHSLFAAPDGALGQVIRLDDQPYEVVGIMPRTFAFPTPAAQFWISPRSRFNDFDDRSNLHLSVVGRLRADVTINQARTDLTAIATGLERAYPNEDAGMGAIAVDLRDVVSPQSRLLVIAAFGAACCLLLIACTNLANLLLGRSLTRRRELAVRAAIGAGRGRLVRQLLTENAVLAVAGGTVGVLIALLVTPFLTRLVPTALPVGGAPTIDVRIVVFAALTTILAALGAGMIPGWRFTKDPDAAALRLRTAGVGSDRLREMLVLAEVAGTVTLLVGAGLLTKALWQVQAVDPGFRPDSVLTLRTALPMPAYSSVGSRAQFYARVLTEVRATPGVVSAGYTSFLPMVFGGGIFNANRPGGGTDPRSGIPTSIRYITSDFFETLRIPIKRGRDVSDRDTQTAPLVTVISDSLARRLWPDDDPIGRQLNVVFAERMVVGVVGDIAVRGIERTSEPQVYLPLQQVRDAWLLFHVPKDLAIRAKDDATALALAPVVSRIIHAVDPRQPVSDVRLLSDITEAQTTARRAQINVLALFAGIAVLLASVGIHGMLTFAVSTRRQEVGIRLAIGAARGDILGMFLRQGLTFGTIGIVLGVPCAYVLGRALSGLLFGVSPADAFVYLAASALALVMTVSGSLRPAIQAASVDPVATMRAE